MPAPVDTSQEPTSADISHTEVVPASASEPECVGVHEDLPAGGHEDLPAPTETIVPVIPAPTNPARKSTRTVKQLIWMEDYVSIQPKTSTTYPLSNYLSYTNVSPSYKISLLNFLLW